MLWVFLNFCQEILKELWHNSFASVFDFQESLNILLLLFLKVSSDIQIELWQGGVLVAVVRGANAPILQKTVINELKAEHAVLDGTKERAEIKDPKFAHLDSDKSGDDESDAADKADEGKMMMMTLFVIFVF